jgi:hypothetical protein
MAYARSYVIKNLASFKIGGVEYKDQITKARLVPETPVQTLRTFGGVDVDVDSTAWTLEIAGHQDRGSGSLGAALDTAVAAGTTVSFCITPKSGSGQDQASGSVRPVPMEFGGEAGSWKLFELELGVVDQPTFGQTS